MNRTQAKIRAESLRALVKSADSEYRDMSKLQVYSGAGLHLKRHVLDLMSTACDSLLEAYKLLTDSLEADSRQDLEAIVREHDEGVGE